MNKQDKQNTMNQRRNVDVLVRDNLLKAIADNIDNNNSGGSLANSRVSNLQYAYKSSYILENTVQLTPGLVHNR